MTIHAQISLHQLTFIHANNTPLFENLSLSFRDQKLGLVGRNGVGKSTLLRLIKGELRPSQGAIECQVQCSYCPQRPVFDPEMMVMDYLGVTDKIKALARIEQGSIEALDYELVAEDWNIREIIREKLVRLDMPEIDLSQAMSSLSGGEENKLSLLKAFESDSDCLLLDEPSNHLDANSREILYRWINDTPKQLIIVSHDRQLLNTMDAIVELSSKGLKYFGGNYDHYSSQKTLMLAATEQELSDAKKQLHKAKRSIQESREKLERRQSRGRKAFLSGRVDKLTANSKKGRSEATQARNTGSAQRMQNDALTQLKAATERYETIAQLSLDLQHTRLASGKKLVIFEEVYFRYASDAPWLIESFNLNLSGPKRLAIKGDNGSGKSTLLRLLMGELMPTQGTVDRAQVRFQYLDQRVTFLDDEKSLIDNYLTLNPEQSLEQAHAVLARFLFRNTLSYKKVKVLSGGERLRAGLACVLMSSIAPQCLILDEPSNHLDFDSLASIESALQQFQGALIVVSHDDVFLTNIGIEHEIVI